SGASGCPISGGSTPDSGAGTPSDGRERMRREMEAGRIWQRGIEWDAVRGLLAQQARTTVGRERALSAEPVTVLATIREALEATRQARTALAEVGPPPVDSPDVRRVVADLERLFQTSDNDRIFADRFVTVRHGRYVVPVRAEARQRLRGIVHDRSQSGQTLFVEPESAVDANNDLVQLTREEEQET